MTTKNNNHKLSATINIHPHKTKFANLKYFSVNHADINDLLQTDFATHNNKNCLLSIENTQAYFVINSKNLLLNQREQNKMTLNMYINNHFHPKNRHGYCQIVVRHHFVRLLKKSEHNTNFIINAPSRHTFSSKIEPYKTLVPRKIKRHTLQLNKTL